MRVRHRPRRCLLLKVECLLAYGSSLLSHASFIAVFHEIVARRCVLFSVSYDEVVDVVLQSFRAVLDIFARAKIVSNLDSILAQFLSVFFRCDSQLLLVVSTLSLIMFQSDFWCSTSVGCVQPPLSSF